MHFTLVRCRLERDVAGLEDFEAFEVTSFKQIVAHVLPLAEWNNIQQLSDCFWRVSRLVLGSVSSVLMHG